MLAHKPDYSRFPKPWCDLGPRMGAEMRTVAGGASWRSSDSPPRRVPQHRLKQCREAAGMTQMQLSKAAGYAQPQISQWERGEGSPDRQAVADLAQALGIEPRNLYAE